MKKNPPEWLHELPEREREFILACRTLPEPEQTALDQFVTWIGNRKDTARRLTADEMTAWLLARAARLPPMPG